MKTRTSNYIMTVDVNSIVDIEQLAFLRKVIKKINKTTGTTFYVKCHGRGSRIRAALNYSGADFLTKYNQYCQELPLKYAKRMDVYVYSR